MNNNIKYSNRVRVLVGFFFICAALLLLSIRLAQIMIVDSDELTKRAVSQQTRDSTIDAKRGVIYDRNGKELATSSICYTLYGRPVTITEEMSIIELKALCQTLADIIDQKRISAEDIEKKITGGDVFVTLAKRLSKEQLAKIRELRVPGLEFSQGTMRYYPLNNFASQVLGSVNDDGVGRTGIELQYNEILSGMNGRWIINTDISGNELVEGTEKYYAAVDGYNFYLTIDEAIQYYCEEEAKAAYKKWKAKKVEILAMDPNNGEILASCVYPGFDPNDPMTPKGLSKKEREKFEKLNDKKKTEYLSRMWRNPLVSDTYEPGSTFKLITAAAAIEEKAISLNEKFYCKGSFRVADYVMHCWYDGAHGKQNVKKALANSCNPAFAEIAKKIGATRFRKYINLFGFGQLTGVDYPGESNSLMQSNIGPVELATLGFGQGISITPIQLATAVSAIGNGGYLVEPHYMKGIADREGKTTETVERKLIRKVISKKTSNIMKDMMEYEVAEGGGGTAKIKGYRIGGKTGTAQKADKGAYHEYDYYSSFICMAPIDDPKITLLVIVDSPRGAQYGSIVAAPSAKNILKNVLRYMAISPVYSEKEEQSRNSAYTVVPDVTGKAFHEAVGIITGKELKYSRPDYTKGKDDWEIVDQYPKAGTKVKKNTIVYVYKD